MHSGIRCGNLLKKPFKDLSSEERAQAFALSDKIAEFNRAQPKPVSNAPVTISMRDKLLENGVISPLDGKTAFHNRHSWAEHLKKNGCVEIGNDFNNATQKKREIKGDFDCRDELGRATYQIAEKYGQ